MSQPLQTDPARLSEVIGLIYETAGDASLWPMLLAAMASCLESTAQKGARVISTVDHETGAQLAERPTLDAQEALFVCLLPHFVRAGELYGKLQDVESERDSMEAILNRLPVGIAIVDRDGSLINVNPNLQSVVQGEKRLRVEAGRLVSVPEAHLREAIDACLEDEGGELTVHLPEDRASGPLSLRVSRRPGTRYAVVMVASRSINEISAASLAEFFELSGAEARFAQNMALGRTVKEASAALNIKESTGRTHVRSLLGKFFLNRQSDLLRTFYASPLWFEAGSSSRPSSVSTGTRLRSLDITNAGQRLKLSNGRWLTYFDGGDSEGLSVILMHCIGGSRHMRHPDDRILESEGIRLLIPDRPGSGGSAPQSDRSILDWCKDIEELTDHLGIKKFAVVGFCGGTPYALAVASALPDRVLSVFIVGGLPHFQQLLDARNFSNAFGAGLLVAKYAPRLLPSLARLVITGIRKNPYRCVERVLAGEPEADRQAFADPRLRARFAASLLAAAKWGDEGLIHEVVLFARDWGFSLESVRKKTVIWHGAMDASANIDAMKQLSRALPDAELSLMQGAGHYLLFSHWLEIWRAIRLAHPNEPMPTGCPDTHSERKGVV